MSGFGPARVVDEAARGTRSSKSPLNDSSSASASFSPSFVGTVTFSPLCFIFVVLNPVSEPTEMLTSVNLPSMTMEVDLVMLSESDFS
jgi:hypothetical protein